MQTITITSIKVFVNSKHEIRGVNRKEKCICQKNNFIYSYKLRIFKEGDVKRLRTAIGFFSLLTSIAATRDI